MGRSWLFTELVLTKELPDGLAFIAGGVLDDGSNLLGMCHPGGQRLFRHGPLGREKEQRRSGTSNPELDQVWGIIIASVLRGEDEVKRLEALPAARRCRHCKGTSIIERKGQSPLTCPICKGTGERP
jgi:DnaJ-class molecular chaperone